MPTSVTLSLPDDVKSFIEQRTQAGSYSSTSEFICQLVRADQKRAEQVRLEEMLVEGLDSGEPIRATDEYWQNLRNGVEKRAAEKEI